ncbi:MAG: ATP synthase F1 subunit delta [Planctomycetes bacterium]|nr:ATP synthase F1 subunit delta [Planctomycetota bacterium]
MSLLAQRYAKALFEVASDAGAVDAVAQDLERLHAVFADEVVANAVLSPDTPSAQRRSLLDKALGDGHALTKNLIGVVLERHRVAVLPELAGAFAPLVRAARGIVLVAVETAKPLDDASRAAVELRARSLAARPGSSPEVALDVAVHPELIGGVRIRIGNTLYDGSVATALEDLERRLREAAI